MISRSEIVQLEILFKGEPFSNLERYCDEKNIKIIIDEIDGKWVSPVTTITLSVVHHDQIRVELTKGLVTHIY